MQPTYEIDNPDIPYQTKLDLWQTGFGLQQVDGLVPSAYMVNLATEHIEGRLDYQQIYDQITTYHLETEDRTKEADIVSLRIVEALSRTAFKFAPTTLKAIHRELFYGLLPHGVRLGEYRLTNISKQEPILDGASVIYDDYRTISDSLDYDFNEEKVFDYRGKSPEEQVEHLKRFISGIWQIHPFGEGNTRTVTVFMIKYLRSLGFDCDNEPFKKQARFFRDALVLDNAKLDNYRPEYLERFFENLLLGGQHALSLKAMYADLGRNKPPY